MLLQTTRSFRAICQFGDGPCRRQIPVRLRAERLLCVRWIAYAQETRRALMVREFQAVLDSLAGKTAESLDEYRELICEMRRRGADVSGDRRGVGGEVPGESGLRCYPRRVTGERQAQEAAAPAAAGQGRSRTGGGPNPHCG